MQVSYDEGGKSLTLTLTNAGNSDVNITDIVLDGAVFSHNATNTQVPRGTSLSVTVTFTPGSVADTQTGTLTFSSDGNPSTLAITLTGAASSSTPPPSPSGGGTFNPPVDQPGFQVTSRHLAITSTLT